MTNYTFKSGMSREQASLLPPRIEDYVGRDNPVRAIDGYVEASTLQSTVSAMRSGVLGWGSRPMIRPIY